MCILLTVYDNVSNAVRVHDSKSYIVRNLPVHL